MKEFKICNKCEYRSHYPFHSIKAMVGFKCPLCKCEKFTDKDFEEINKQRSE